MRISTSKAVQAGNPECQDRAEIIRVGERFILVLADGAGGISGGARAADAFIRLVRDAAENLRNSEDCVRLLIQIDQALARDKACGETTGVLAVVDSGSMVGASVGDSAAWLFTKTGSGELTYNQPPKPLLGSGEAATPRGFTWPIEDGTLVIASDGLWKYTTIDAIASRVETRDSEDLALRLTELPRLKSGTFPDDVAVITCRMDLAQIPFKAGDQIRVLQVPPAVALDMPPETVELFTRCVGRVFRIDGIDEHGHLELCVTGDGEQAPDCCQHTIWIEPEFVERAE